MSYHGRKLSGVEQEAWLSGIKLTIQEKIKMAKKEHLHITYIKYSLKVILMLKVVFISFLFVDIYKNMHLTPLFVSRHFCTPVVVSIFNSRCENKNKFWKYIARNSKIFSKNVSVN